MNKECKLCKNDGYEDVFVMETTGLCFICNDWLSKRQLRITEHTLKEVGIDISKDAKDEKQKREVGK